MRNFLVLISMCFVFLLIGAVESKSTSFEQTQAITMFSDQGVPAVANYINTEIPEIQFAFSAVEKATVPEMLNFKSTIYAGQIRCDINIIQKNPSRTSIHNLNQPYDHGWQFGGQRLNYI